MTVALLRTSATSLEGEPGDRQVIERALLVWCPGCAESADWGGLHRMPVEAGPAHDGGPVWEWNGDLERPTTDPSILVTGDRAGVKTRCHSYLRDGVWEFLDDCTHPLAGQRVPLPDLPDWVTRP